MTNPTGDALKASAALDEDKFCMTDKGPKLWKEIAQDAFDALEWHRSSLNPKWEEVRQSALPVEQAPQSVPTEVAWKDGFIVGQTQPGMDAHWVWMQRRDALRPAPPEAPVEQAPAKSETAFKSNDDGTFEFNPAHGSKETADQMAAVMLVFGTSEQKVEVLAALAAEGSAE